MSNEHERFYKTVPMVGTIPENSSGGGGAGLQTVLSLCPYCCGRQTGGGGGVGKPDPLVDVFCKGLWSEAGLSISTKEIRAALEARGLEIREKNDD